MTGSPPGTPPRASTTSAVTQCGAQDVGGDLLAVAPGSATATVPIRLRLIHDDATDLRGVEGHQPHRPAAAAPRPSKRAAAASCWSPPLTRRWGSRRTPEGKTIWTEPALGED